MEKLSHVVTVAVVNFKVSSGEKDHNLQRIIEFSIAAAKRGADIVLFPELCLMGYDYFINDQISQEQKIQMTETLEGPSCVAIEKVAKAHNIYVVFGMSEKEAGKAVLYNSAVAVGPEGLLGSYRKMHPFETESSWCVKGHEPFMFPTKWGPISIGICFDTYQFPELMRYYVGKGSRLYLNPTAVMEELPKEGSRQAFLNYYGPTLEYGVLCNTIFIASANLTGYEDTTFWGGGSAILGPKITPFYETDVTYYGGDKNNLEEGLYLATLDLSLATRRLCQDKPYTGEPDYRPNIYKQFL